MENSSVPKIIPKRNLSHKEMDYKQKWDENFKKLREQELYYVNFQKANKYNIFL